VSLSGTSHAAANRLVIALLINECAIACRPISANIQQKKMAVFYNCCEQLLVHALALSLPDAAGCSGPQFSCVFTS
jgi:hypothetical protein